MPNAIIEDLTALVTTLTPAQQSAIHVLAKQSARKAVKRRIQAEGRIKPWWIVTSAEISKLAGGYLRQHPELFAQAAASPIVQNLQVTNRQRRPAAQGLSLCRSQERNGGGQ
jgi:hypothetical protein